MSGEYYCEFCNESIMDELHMCKAKYDYVFARAAYETMGWEEEPPPEWNLKLDKTGTKLVPRDKIGVEVP